MDLKCLGFLFVKCILFVQYRVTAACLRVNWQKIHAMRFWKRISDLSLGYLIHLVCILQSMQSIVFSR